ncbi:DNA (cytosine-5-)-methyltransferase N-terminal subunit [Mycoplasma sp. 1573]
MKKIRLYEAFSGIGSQYKALKNISSELDIEAVSVGQIEWYIDAIVSYQVINYGILEPEFNIDSNEQIRLLSKFNFSNDSKAKVSKDYFKKLSVNKLNAIFSYLYSFINNDYFEKRYGAKREEDFLSYTDILSVKHLPEKVDIFTYSFPCQDISLQGKQLGFNGNTRSSLLYEVKRILEHNKNNLPKVLVLENVKALVKIY